MNESQSNSEEQPIELVLLLSEELIVDAYFLHTAYKDVLNLDLTYDKSGSEEFITGQYPFFFAQTKGVTLGINILANRFGSEEFNDVFPNHNFKEATMHLNFWQRLKVKRHRGWISAFFMRDASCYYDANPYPILGHFLSPFANPRDSIALINPQSNITVMVNRKLQKKLICGETENLFV